MVELDTREAAHRLGLPFIDLCRNGWIATISTRLGESETQSQPFR